MDELIEEFRKTYAGDPILETVINIVQASYERGYSDGFMAGEEATKDIVDLLTKKS